MKVDDGSQTVERIPLKVERTPHMRRPSQSNSDCRRDEPKVGLKDYVWWIVEVIICLIVFVVTRESVFLVSAIAVFVSLGLLLRLCRHATGGN